MSKDIIQKYFPDSTTHTMYKITITSENDETFEAKADDLDIREIMEHLV